MRASWLLPALLSFLVAACGLAPLEDGDAVTTTDPGGQDATDPGTANDPGADVAVDPGTTTDPGTPDPGTVEDPGTDGTPVDPGTADPGETDPGAADPGPSDPGADVPATGCCDAYVACLRVCPAATFDACRADCETQTAPAAEALALGTCLKDAGCFAKTSDSEFGACSAASCKTQSLACLGSCGPAKKKTCAEVIACLDPCPDDDPATPAVDEYAKCETLCFQASEQGAIDQYNAWAACANSKCTVCAGTDALACFQCTWNVAYGGCKADYQPCARTGTSVCSDVLVCAVSCQDLDCTSACAAKATFALQVLYHDLYACVVAACPDPAAAGYAECRSAAYAGQCAAAYDACVADAGT